MFHKNNIARLTVAGLTSLVVLAPATADAITIDPIAEIDAQLRPIADASGSVIESHANLVNETVNSQITSAQNTIGSIDGIVGSALADAQNHASDMGIDTSPIQPLIEEFVPSALEPAPETARHEPVVQQLEPYTQVSESVVQVEESTIVVEKTRAQNAVDFAHSRKGTPYVYGGTTDAGYDCSGFVQAAYRSAGVEIPRTTQQQAQYGASVAYSDLQPGDLVLYGSSPVTAYHAAIYIGDGKVIHSPQSGDVVKESNVNMAPIAAIKRVS